jgi:hypothetical protein
MTIHPDPPVPESYWVRPGQLLAGAYPIRVGEAEHAHQRVQQFLAVGVTSFVDLTEAHEFIPYLPVFRAVVPAGVGLPAYQRLPIRNWDIPPPLMMVQILDTIDTALAAGQSVYVHCAGGIGRTGTVVGCYLVRHGLQGEAALTEIMRLRHALPNSGDLSPRREPQRQMVRTWPIGR